MKHYKFFTNKDCEYYPCHQVEGELNCLFCYCPLYFLECPGSYTLLENGRKDCSACTLPHEEGGWEMIQMVLENPRVLK